MSATHTVRHPKFYIDDTKPFVTLLVEGQLFRVHRYMFELESEMFRTMFRSAEGETDESPIVLQSVSVPEVEALLTFFYFRQGLEEVEFSKGDWCDLLSISHKYECKHARERSIKEINKLNLPIGDVDKIVMAKKFGVEGWLLSACVALVERQAPLAYAEAEKLGLDMTVLLSEARETYIQQQQSGPRIRNSSGGGAPSVPVSGGSLFGRQNVSVFGQPTDSAFGQQTQTSSDIRDTTQLVKEILHIN